MDTYNDTQMPEPPSANLRRVSYREDFSLLVRLKDTEGEDMPLPSYDFDLILRTSGSDRVYVATKRGERYTSLKVLDADSMLLSADGHGLYPGRLQIDFIAYLPCADMADGTQRVGRVAYPDIELVEGATDAPTEMEVALIAPYIVGAKGEPLRYSDLTDDQIADLQRPAVAAAARADEAADLAAAGAVKVETAVGKAEAASEAALSAASEAKLAMLDASEAAKSAESAADSAVSAAAETRGAAAEMEAKTAVMTDSEQKRVAAEVQRDAAEERRRADEQLRVAAEAGRDAAETGRVAAEDARVESERARTLAEGLRSSREEERVVSEARRVAGERARQDAEEEREEAEAVRASAEEDREEAESLRVESFAAMDSRVTLAEKKLFVDMWRSRLERVKAIPTYAEDKAATLDDGSQFGINGLVLTYGEAVVCYRDSVFQSAVATNLYGHKYPVSRTVFPTLLGGTAKDMSWMYSYCRNIEVISFYSGYGNIEKAVTLKGAFYDCMSLVRILGIIECFNKDTAMNSAFFRCDKLEDFRIKSLRESMSLADSPKVNLESLSYLIENAENVKPIVVTVHPDTFAKLTDEGNAEWFAVAREAVAKDISFATV